MYADEKLCISCAMCNMNRILNNEVLKRNKNML